MPTKRKFTEHLCTTCNGTFTSRSDTGARYCSVRCARAARPAWPLSERFWSKVEKTGPVPAHSPELGPCWLWTGKPAQTGYGVITVWREERGYRSVGAHRIVWELTQGPVPNGSFCLHKCDVPLCVNPSHLYLGTQADNVRDEVDRGRIARGDRSGARLHPETRARGERHPMAKLTAEKVRAMRADHAAGRATYRELAKREGVTGHTTWLILSRQTWRHV